LAAWHADRLWLLRIDFMAHLKSILFRYIPCNTASFALCDIMFAFDYCCHLIIATYSITPSSFGKLWPLWHPTEGGYIAELARIMVAQGNERSSKTTATSFAVNLTPVT
jgi:hypothetical protein